jgi:endo-1,4-beta-xylanase
MGSVSKTTMARFMIRPLISQLLAVVFPISVVAAETMLKDAFEGDFLIGTALNSRHIAERDPATTKLIASQFNAVTAENAMKWQAIQPQPGVFRFEAADRFVAFGEQHGMFIVGHTLVWHSQTPAWVFQGADGNPAGRDELLERMRRHIHTVVGRYRGRVHGWDVVNEALNEDGSLRDSPWRRILGDDYLAHAFRFAHEADPEAKLYYNDYSLENRAKLRGAVALVESLLKAGVPLHAVGTQSHINLQWPSLRQIEETITTLAGLGVKVMVSELDVDVLPSRTRSVNADVSRREEAAPELNPYADGLPEHRQAQLARRYAEIFEVYLKHRDVIERVTFWGVTDADSWLNHFPIRGRTNHPLLFDRAARPKPALEAVTAAAAGFRERRAADDAAVP